MMITKTFAIDISAPQNIVWRALWEDRFYRDWTSLFAEGSYAEGEWKQGGEIRFLTPEGSGMYSVAENFDEPHEISFRHLGEIKDNEKLPAWPADQQGTESYYLSGSDNMTRVSVEMEMPDNPEYTCFFEDVFPKALSRLKELAESEDARKVTIETTVNSGAETVWKAWTDPEHIKHWNTASDDWHTPSAENDPRPGGRFSYRMEARDGSAGFDFAGTYEEVRQEEYMSFRFDDGRRVSVVFAAVPGGGTKITESFEIEEKYGVAFQRAGWQAILDNFKSHVEKL